MFTSILRRVPAFITAGAAAVAVLALAVPAGASTGAQQTSPQQVGYTTTGAQFKQVYGTVYLRNPARYAGMVARYGHSAQLWSSDIVVTVDFTASTSGKTYTPSATIYDRGTHQVIAFNTNATHHRYSEGTLPGVDPPVRFGDHLNLGITYSPATGHLDMWAENPLVLYGHRSVVQQGQDRHRLRQFAVGRVLLLHPARGSGEPGRLHRRVADQLQRPQGGPDVVVGVPQAARPALQPRPRRHSARPDRRRGQLPDLVRAEERPRRQLGHRALDSTPGARVQRALAWSPNGTMQVPLRYWSRY